MINTIVGSTVGIVVCLSLVYITRWLSEIVDTLDSDSK